MRSSHGAPNLATTGIPNRQAGLQAIANERLKRNHAGQVVLQFKSPYRDSTTHIVMSPFEHPADHAHAHGSAARMRWALLLKRVFDMRE